MDRPRPCFTALCPRFVRPLRRRAWRWLGAGLAMAVLLLASGCRGERANDGKIHVTYWEKWVSFEGVAMQQVVDAFNRSQDRIVVDYYPVSQVDQKTLVATAGGDPPDV